MIPLGPFVLEQAIGRGGMAIVWRAVHREQRQPVAIKVLTTDAARNPLFFSTFRSEVRGAAGLDHPGIVAVYDHGLVTEAAATASKGKLAAASPYLVMELAGRGTLSPHCGKLPWKELQAVLLGLLDALAHAHARGVIHRDLKPANVLVDRETGSVKLTDFGLVHAFTQRGAGVTGEEFIGTPAYMAPEQLEVRWRDYGPWTDLYAVGCLSWALATGDAPFGTDMSIEQALTAHLRLTPPPMRPALSVPDGFEAWVRRLLAKEPRQRFRRAADAAWALAKLPPPKDAGPPSEVSIVSPAEPRTVVVPRTAHTAGRPVKDAPTTQAPHLRPRPKTSPGRRAPRGAYSPRIPPLPASWQRSGDDEHATWMRGVGLGVYGVRSIPLVDREAERDLLWDALREVRTERRFGAVLLEGAAGSGKTRLADWLAERAHETGSAIVLRATHGSRPSPSSGISGMLVRYGRLDGLKRRNVRKRVARLLADRGRLADEEVDAVTEIASPAEGKHRRAGHNVIRFASPDERYTVLAGVLEVLSRERPVVLVADDVHYGADALGFCLHLQRAVGRELPILVVMTARDDLLVERVAERELVDALLDGGARRIPVGPLPAARRGELIRGLLGLDGALAERVQERTAGNPLFAVQLVGDWVQRGLLEAGAGGFRLKSGVEAALPDDVHTIWLGRADRVLSERRPADALALELAAVLGRTIEPQEWSEVCGLAHVIPSDDLVDDLVEQRLAVLDKEGTGRWSFVHGMLRESLERRARDADRLEDHHAAAAAMLAGSPGASALERRGRHLVAAGQPRAALAPLAAAVAGHLNGGEFRRASGLLERYDRALGELRRPSDHPAAVRGKVLAARVARLQGALERASRIALSAMLASRERTDPDGRAVYCEALIELGNSRIHLGELAEAREHLTEALALAQEQGAVEQVALCRRHLSFVKLSEGDTAGAAEEARAAVFAAEAGGDSAMVAQAYQILSRCSLVRGQMDEASFFLSEAHLRFRRAGARWGVATALNSMGEIARERGELRDAEAHYRDAADRYAAIGSGDAVYPNINLGLLLVEQERWDDALDILRPLGETVARQKRGPMQAAVSVALLPCLAQVGDFEAFDQEAARAAELLSETGFVDADIARKATQAGAAATAAGEADRARVAFAIARDQWTGLGKGDEVDAVDSRLLAL